ncbi:hypothetical protein AAG570_001518 [Ranatra chinensis]|uniref:Uncharacterized protein n=1 Tax=Ranatra chinensis TaxID=642074 RepID=A0ABD0Y8T0_9HEMI
MKTDHGEDTGPPRSEGVNGDETEKKERIQRPGDRKRASEDMDGKLEDKEEVVTREGSVVTSEYQRAAAGRSILGGATIDILWPDKHSAIKACMGILLTHPPTPFPVPSAHSFSLFIKLKEISGGKRFSRKEDEVKEAVEKWLSEVGEGTKKLVPRLNRSVEVEK